MYIIAKMRSFFQVTHCRNSAYNSMRKHKGSYMDLNQNVNENVDTGTLRIHLTNESKGTLHRRHQRRISNLPWISGGIIYIWYYGQKSGDFRI